MPSYVKLDKLSYDKSAWIGAEHNGYEPNGELELKTSIEKFRERMAIVDALEDINELKTQHMAKSWSDIRKQAGKVITGNVAEAFRLDKEKNEVVKKYKAEKSKFCEHLLVAKRLVERGCRFVSIVNGGWDHHQDLFPQFVKLSEDLDYGVATLIGDIHQAGLSKDCMVILTTEFGRTSKINGTAGRDHQAGVTPLLISGGNYDQGRIIGTHDDRATAPTSKPITPFDLCATIFDHFSLPKDAKRTDNAGRPRYLLEGGTCIL
jgi:uncharacterized protein (DUF1501 family)